MPVPGDPPAGGEPPRRRRRRRRPTTRGALPPITSATAFAAACALAMAATAARAAHAPTDQSQWGERHTRNMVSVETGLPDSFDPETGRNVRWTADLGTATYATPVVARGRVLIGTNNGRPRDPKHRGDRAVLMCFDEEDGGFVWQLVVPKLGERYSDWPNVGLCSAPTVEGERVYVVSNRAEIMCLDIDGLGDGNDGPYFDEGRHMTRGPGGTVGGTPRLEVGETDADIIWLYDMSAEVGVWQHDTAHCSILIDGPYLYVCTSNGVDDTHRGIRAPDAPSLVVVEKATGRLVAVDNERIGPDVFHSTWSSPSLGVVNGRRLVFFCGGNGVCYAFEAVRHGTPGVDAGKGAEAAKLELVWRFDFDTDRPEGDPHQYQGNRRESPSNICGMPVFQEAHGGRIYVAGGGDVWHGKREAWIKCVDAAGTGDVTGTAEVWSYRLKRHCMSTPAVKDGLVYISDCDGQVHCLDAETGRPVWVHDARREIWGSPLVADGKVYVGTRGRELWVLAEGREKRVIGHVRLDSAISGTPVAANGVLYVTTMRKLHAVKAVKAGAQRAGPETAE